jgi:hypothetical protein
LGWKSALEAACFERKLAQMSNPYWMYLEPCWLGWHALLEKEISGAMFCAVFGEYVYSIFGILLVRLGCPGRAGNQL